MARVGSKSVAPLVAAMRQVKADVPRALALANLDPAEVADPEGRVLHANVVRLWQLAVEFTGDNEIGLRASALIPPGAFGVVEYALCKSPTLMEGLRRISRYFRLVHDVAEIIVEIDGDRVIIDHRLPGVRSLPRAATDFVLSNAARLIQDAVDGELVPLETWLDYAEPADTTALHQRFGTCLKFSTGRRALVFARSDTERTLRQSEPGLCAILDQHASDMLAKLPTVGSFTDHVRELLAAQLAGGNPTSQEMARALKMSMRTLHRRLSEDGTSHKQLLTELRQQLANKYLLESDVAISEVAFLLGFSEPSAFHRAFRRWTGKTPASVRAAR